MPFTRDYDNRSLPLDQLACYKNDAIMPGYNWKTLGEIPVQVLALDSIIGPDSSMCASCWMLEFGESVLHFLALDGATSPMVISHEAMKSLTGHASEGPELITMDATLVEMLNCGLYDPPEEREL